MVYSCFFPVEVTSSVSPGRFRGLIGDGTIVAVAERGMVDALEAPCVGNGVACRLPRGLTSAVDSGGVDCIERDALVAGSNKCQSISV